MRKPSAEETEYWESLLEAEGMPAELPLIASEYKSGPGYSRQGSRIEGMIEQLQVRREHAEAYYNTATDYLWACNWDAHPVGDRRIWEWHCQGFSQYQIGAKESKSRTSIQERVEHHRSLALRGKDA